MEKIVVKGIRSDGIYKKIMEADKDRKDDMFRYDLMKLFEKKWEIYKIPLKAKQPGGYDIIMASGMLGYLVPQKVDERAKDWITDLSDDVFWEKCQHSIEQSLKQFIDAGIELPLKEYVFTLMLADPESPYSKMNDNYCGDGGIPGFIFGSLVPSEFTKTRLPIALAHETNHNVRFQFVKWRNDISLGEYMICEGLAENFAAHMYGEENVGPWVSKTDAATLNEYIKPLIKEALHLQGLDNISAYMYGDEMAAMQNYVPAGMPYCAGYACGYHMIRYFLEKTGISIVQATLMPAEDIMKEIQDFWDIETEF